MKKKTKSTDTATFDFKTTPRTADDDILDASLAASAAPDPSIPFQYANAQKSLDNHIDDQFGANYSPETAAAMKYAGSNELNQQRGFALSQDAFRRSQAKFGNSLAIRNARAPQLVKTGGTQTQEENSASFWNNLILGSVTGGIGMVKPFSI